MGNAKSQDDLWEQFLQDDDSVDKPKKVKSDGTEWSGEFDRRKKPRDENNLADDVAGDNLDLSSDAANDDHIDDESESGSNK